MKAETPGLYAPAVGLPALCQHACIPASSHLGIASCSFLFPTKASGGVSGLRFPLRCSSDPGEACAKQPPLRAFLSGSAAPVVGSWDVLHAH